MPTVLRCPTCQVEAPSTTSRFRCACGEPFDVVHSWVDVSRATFDGRLGAGGAAPHQHSGVWRFQELVHPSIAEASIVSRPEGNTPLYDAPAVARYAGVGWLRLKHEGMNPTGSFKDRGMTVAMSQAVASGARAVVCASTGNTSASVAAYAAIRELPAVILVPEGATAIGKLSQALAYGARTLIVRGDFDAAMALVQAASDDLGLYVLNSLNPFRIEGQQTIVLEVLQQLGWEAPDWIVFPAGNLGNCASFGKALASAHAHGLISRIPRLLAVQASGSAPFAQAFARGFDQLEPVRAETVATAIRIGDPVSYRRAVRSIRDTNGAVTSVSDAEILDAKAVIDAAGVGAEPASCASVAGLRRLVSEGVVRPEDRVVAVLTGHLLKDPDTTMAYHAGRIPGATATGPAAAGRANPPVTIDPTVASLAAALARSVCSE